MMLSSGVAVVLWYPQALAVSYQILTTMPTLSDSMTASSDTCTHALMDQIRSDVYIYINMCNKDVRDTVLQGVDILPLIDCLQ